MREALREVIEHGIDEQGRLVERRSMQTVEVLSRARRIRYTRGFFPASTADLRLRLFTNLGNPDEIAIDQAVSPDLDAGDDWEESAESGQAVKPSSWVLYEHEEFSREIEDYWARRQSALIESVESLRDGRSLYSRRVVSIWAYQRRRAGVAAASHKSMREE